MSHKYIRRAGTWGMRFKFNDTTTVIRTCPICNFTQPLDVSMLQYVDFSKCPKCNSLLDIPKKINY